VASAAAAGPAGSSPSPRRPTRRRDPGPLKRAARLGGNEPGPATFVPFDEGPGRRGRDLGFQERGIHDAFFAFSHDDDDPDLGGPGLLGPGGPSLADEPRAEEAPVLGLFDGLRSGALQVSAEGTGGDRMTLSVTNRSSRPLRVVLPPGLLASGAAGQFGGGGFGGGGFGGDGFGGGGFGGGGGHGGGLGGGQASE